MLPIGRDGHLDKSEAYDISSGDHPPRVRNSGWYQEMGAISHGPHPRSQRLGERVMCLQITFVETHFTKSSSHLSSDWLLTNRHWDGDMIDGYSWTAVSDIREGKYRAEPCILDHLWLI